MEWLLVIMTSLLQPLLKRLLKSLKNSVRHSLKRRNRAERGLGECLQLCIICMPAE